MGVSSSSNIKLKKRMSREEQAFVNFYTKTKPLMKKFDVSSRFPEIFSDWNRIFLHNQTQINPLEEAGGRVLLLGSTTDIKKGEKPLMHCFEELFNMKKFFTSQNYANINIQGPLTENGKNFLIKSQAIRAIEEEIGFLVGNSYQNHLIIYFSGKSKPGEGWQLKDGTINFNDVTKIWKDIIGSTLNKELLIIVDTNYSGEWCEKISQINYIFKVGAIASCKSKDKCPPTLLAHSFAAYGSRDKSIFNIVKNNQCQFQAAIYPDFSVWSAQNWLYFMDESIKYYQRNLSGEKSSDKSVSKPDLTIIAPGGDENTQIGYHQQKIGNKNIITVNVPEGTDITIAEFFNKYLCPNKHKLEWSPETIKCSGCYGYSVGFSCKECKYYIGRECLKYNYNSIKCPNEHKLYWSSEERECAECTKKHHGMACISCQFNLCSHCSKIEIKPDLCPNFHPLKWYSTPGQCLRCHVISSGMQCKSCGFKVCSDCANVPLPSDKCLNGHALHWTVDASNECLKCKQKNAGKMCPGCNYFLCNSHAKVEYQVDICPNNHQLVASAGVIFCLLCYKKERGQMCISCKYNVCDTCVQSKKKK